MTHEEQLVAVARDLAGLEASLLAAEAERALASARLDQVQAKCQELRQDMGRNRDRLLALARAMPPAPPPAAEAVTVAEYRALEAGGPDTPPAAPARAEPPRPRPVEGRRK